MKTRISVFKLLPLLVGISILLIGCPSNNDDDEIIIDNRPINGFVLAKTHNFDIGSGTHVFPCNSNNEEVPEMTLFKDIVFSMEIIPAYFPDTTTEYVNLLDKLILEKDSYFVLFEYENNGNIQIERTSADIVRTDGNKVGIYTEWIPTTTTSGYEDFYVTLVKNPTITSDNGYGEATGDNNLRFKFRIKIENP